MKTRQRLPKFPKLRKSDALSELANRHGSLLIHQFISSAVQGSNEHFNPWRHVSRITFYVAYLQMSARVDYDKIAEIYDSQPFRSKEVDAELLAFLDERAGQGTTELAILDISCGTGNQLVANRAHLPDVRMVGLDPFHGMLRQARRKADDIDWVQADGAKLPFQAASFDFITNQFAFHHVRDKPSMMSEVFRVLRSGGRFVMTNIAPREMRDWIYYRYFPAALEIDLQDFLPKEEMKALMQRTGFDRVEIELNPYQSDQALHDFSKSAGQRDACSQLITISDTDYQAGLQRIDTELRRARGNAISISTKICFLTIVGEKPK